jgi:probable DNA repair protein
MAEPYRIQLQQAVAAAFDGATVVTANTRASRYLLRQCDRGRAGGNGTWLTPSLLPLNAWLDELWRTAQVCGAMNRTLLGPAQQQALWSQIIEGGPPSAASGSKRLAQLAVQAWELVHAYDIPLRFAQFFGPVEAASFLSWAAAYGDHLAAKGWADAAMEIDLLLPRLSALKEWLPKRMAFVGFDSFTPQQRRLMSALESQSVALTVVTAEPGSETAEGLHTQPVRVIKLADRAAELRNAATWARAHLERDPGIQAGVVVAGLSEIRGQVEQAFSAVLHPEQFFSVRDISQPAFDISLGRPLADYPIVHSALTFLRLLPGPLSLAEFSGWLRSPYFGALGQQVYARALLDQSLAETLRPSVTLEAIMQAARKIQTPAATELIRQLRPAGELAKRPPQHAQPQRMLGTPERARPLRPGLWLDELAKALSAAGWPGEGGGISLSSEEHQAREAWEDLLSEVGSLELVEPAMNLPQVIERLLEAASAKIFKPENQSAPVQVMGELEAGGSAFDALWIAGWSDSDWPRRHAPNPLIPIALQREYNLPHHSAAAELAFARAVTGRLLASAPEVVVSWPAAEEDRELRASPLIRCLGVTSDADATRIVSPAKGLAELFPAVALEAVSDDRGPMVAADELRSHSVRILERQSNCPFRAFVELRLLASERQPREEGLAATERGKLVELALQRAWEQLGDRFTLENCGDARLQEIIGAAVDEALRECKLQLGDQWEARYFALERERLCALLREWLQFERSREDFEVIAHQRDIQLELAGLPLRGRLDRLDRLRDGSLVIIDYKTGQQALGPSQWRTPRPVQPQLPSYAVALASGGAEQHSPNPAPAIAAVAFALVNRGDCRMTGLGERPEILGRKKAARGEGLRESLASWRPELESLARDFMNGDARIAPRRASTCDDTYCHLQAVCRMAEIDFPTEPLEDEDDASQ